MVLLRFIFQRKKGYRTKSNYTNLEHTPNHERAANSKLLFFFFKWMMMNIPKSFKQKWCGVKHISVSNTYCVISPLRAVSKKGREKRTPRRSASKCPEILKKIDCTY